MGQSDSEEQVVPPEEAGRGLLALIDQVIVSGAGFLCAILLARYSAVEEYGAYVLIFSIMLIINGFQTAMITDPLTYLCAEYHDRKLSRYVSSLFVAQTVLGLLSAGLAAAGYFIAMSMGVVPIILKAIMGLCAAVAFVQFRELFRRLLFARFRLTAALISDGLYAFILLVGVVTLWKGGILTAESVFYLIAIASVLAAGIAGYHLRDHFCSDLTWSDVLEMLRSNWSFGRWQLIGLAGSYGYLQANTIIVAAMLGTVAAAELHAAQNLLLPIQLLLVGIGNYASPRASWLYVNEGRSTLQRFVMRWTGLLAVLAVVYCGTMALAPAFFLDLLYGGKYPGAGILVRIWAVAFLVLALRRFPTVGIVAMRRPDIAVFAGLGGGIVSVILCLVLADRIGVAGAAAARAGAEIVILLVVGVFFFLPGVDHKPSITISANDDRDGA